MPVLIAEPQDQRRTADKEHDKHGGIDRPKAGCGIDQGKGKKWRGKDHRLGIGDLRMAAEDIRRPEGGLAIGKALRQELDLRLEMRLGIPRNGDPAGKPRPANHQCSKQEQAERKTQPILGSAFSIKGFTPPPRWRDRRKIGVSGKHALLHHHRAGRWGLICALPAARYSARLGQRQASAATLRQHSPLRTQMGRAGPPHPAGLVGSQALWPLARRRLTPLPAAALAARRRPAAMPRCGQM